MLPFTNYYISSPSISENDISSTNKNSSSKKRRPMPIYGGEGDNLEVVKAAAWAWYQRKEGKPIMREFDLARAPRTPRPSRYKIEALKNMILLENRVLAENRVSKFSLWYTNYPFRGDQETQYSRLLDTYENISKRLNIDDSYLCASSSNDLCRDHFYVCDDHSLLQKRNVYNTTSRINDYKIFNNGFMKKVSKKILWKGITVISPGSTVCGRSDDVVSQAGRRTIKVAAAAESLVSLTASGKTRSGRRLL